MRQILRTTKLTIILIASFCFSLNAGANDGYITSADISYVCKGNNKFEINFAIYTECGTERGDLASEGNITLSYYSTKLGVQGEIDVFKSGNPEGEIIKILCEDKESNCTNENEARGLERYTYSSNRPFSTVKLLDLSSYDETNDWVIFFRQEGSSSSINTLATRNSYYTKATISTENGCNSSPTFGQDQIITACTGEKTTYSLLPNIPNGHTLELEFTTPRQTTEAISTYSAGFSKEMPVSMSTPIEGFPNGDIIFTATTPNQVGITDVLIKEYNNNGGFVGSTSQGIQVNTFSCANDKPVISGFNGEDGVYEISVCAGQVIGDSILGTDINLTDKLTWSIISADKNGVISLPIPSVAKTKATFNWGTTLADTGRYVFNLKLMDNGCPVSQSSTQTFVVNVNPVPVFDLGPDTYYECDKDLSLSASPSYGTDPFSYTWVRWDYYKLDKPNFYYIDTVSLTNEVLNIQPGGYSLVITDNNGCAYSDRIYHEVGLTADITLFDKWCVGDFSTFLNTSEVKHGTIVKAFWDLGHDGFTSTNLDSVVHQFPDTSKYEIKLVVENSFGCKDSTTYEFQYCVLPEISFIREDSCEIQQTIWNDTTTYKTCNIMIRRWYLDDSLNGTTERWATLMPDVTDFKTSVPDSGWHNIKLEVEALGGCTKEVTIPYYYYPKPIIEFMEGGVLLDPFFINCDNPDTTLKVVTLDTANGGLVYQWQTTLQIINDTTLKANSTGAGTNIVTDMLGCKDTTSTSITFPLKAEMGYDLVCEEGDTVKFNNFSTVSSKLKEATWHFGFSDSTSNIYEPKVLFPDRIDYSVSLVIEDTTGCKDSTQLTVYNTGLVDSISITPDFDSIICEGNPIVGQVGFNLTGKPSHVNQVIWTKDGLNTVFPGGFGLVYPYTFTGIGQHTIAAEVMFNKNNKNIITSGPTYCLYEYYDTTEIFPRLDGSIRDNRVCLGDVAEFEFFRENKFGDDVRDSSIVQTSWIFTERNKPSIVLYTTTGKVAELYMNRDFDVYAYVVDTNGCKFNTKSGHIVTGINPPTIVYEPGCPNEEIIIKVTHNNDENRFLDAAYIEDTTKLQLQDQKFVYNADKDNNDLFIQPPGGWGPFHSGINEIKVFVESSTVDRYGLPKECRGVLDTTIVLYDLPVPGFYADTVCSKHFLTSFTDTSSIGNGSIIKYGWIFENGTELTSKDAQYILKSGSTNPVSHYVVSDSGCVDTLTSSVYVHNTPDANFTFNSVLAEAFLPIDFFDQSEDHGTTLDSTWYEFGDGSSREETFDATHTYDSVKVYFVKHAVNNEFGCWDTIIKRTDLNVYLDIANAFSPNGDLINDEIGLIHKGIRQLYEFKIFNRWGEVVFDAEGDLQATWDGTFRGIDQEIGGYVVHVKALGAYNEEFNFKRDISLIR